jgi:hypothetical protein
MANTIEMIGKLKEDNRSLRRELKRLMLVNELNIVMFHDTQRQQDRLISNQSQQLATLKHRTRAGKMTETDWQEISMAANDE